jgi:hypothetical protein
MRRTATVIVVGLIALVIAGCGGSGATAAPPASPGASTAPETVMASEVASVAPGDTSAAVVTLPDPCSLLTQDEIQGIIGKPVMAGAPDVGNSCHWERTDVHDISVSVHLLDLQGILPCQTGGTSPVDGLGTAAGWRYTDNIGTGSITACQSGVQVQIVLVGDLTTHTTTADQLKGDATQLMTTVLPRI